MPVIAVEGGQTLVFLPSNSKGEGSSPAGIGEERGEQVVYFIRHAIELVAQTIVEGQVR